MIVSKSNLKTKVPSVCITAFYGQMLRGKKDTRTTLNVTFFYGVWKSRPFLRCCVAVEKSPRFLNSVKKHGFEICSNIFFALVLATLLHFGSFVIKATTLYLALTKYFTFWLLSFGRHGVRKFEIFRWPIFISFFCLWANATFSNQIQLNLWENVQFYYSISLPFCPIILTF